MTYQVRAIEKDFPIEFASHLAEHESWRKELFKPPYYIHKWWARRLGSVFRTILLASAMPEYADIIHKYSEGIALPNIVVFDPFMGSGTTVGEAVKLGCRVVGKDINPVSYMMVKSALQTYSRSHVKAVFEQLSQTAGFKIRSFYTAQLPSGEIADVLYYFWVKQVICPSCHMDIDLFKRRVFAQDAMPGKQPLAKSLCPACCAVNDVCYNQTNTTCPTCATTYNPQSGIVNKGQVVCPKCQTAFTLLSVLRKSGTPLRERIYAKMVLTASGKKLFLPYEATDEIAYGAAERELAGVSDYIPEAKLCPGYNTNQALNYNYHYWYQMFNARQLASLGLLAREISHIEDDTIRLLFACLFSGTLEFNNMFTTFKGTGTGAVRHMFSHHVLKPELTPLEANVWGTNKSSGSFSTLFYSRIMRALDYKDNPFELLVQDQGGKTSSQRVFGISKSMNMEVVSNYQQFQQRDSVYLSAGDSSRTDIAVNSVDLIITDPPFFNNVHYSELADFFYVWLAGMLPDEQTMAGFTTRSLQEVQNTDADSFASNLTAVFSECHRVLKDDGLLVFTYHHARAEGWTPLYRALKDAGFKIVNAHPVKSEMEVSVSIQQAKAAINIDLIIVCRKKQQSTSPITNKDDLLASCCTAAKVKLVRLQRAAINVSFADAKVVLIGCLLPRLLELDGNESEMGFIAEFDARLDIVAKQLIQSMPETSGSYAAHPQMRMDI